MKALLMSIVVAFAVTNAFAAGKGTSRSTTRSVETIAQERKIDLSKLRGEKSTRESREAIARSAAPALAKDLRGGLDQNTIIKLSSIEGALELVLHTTELKADQSEARDLYLGLLDIVSATMDSNASSASNKQIGKLFALLSSGKATPEMVNFAKKLNESLAVTRNPAKSLLEAAETFAKAKNMTVQKWLEELERCLA